MKGSRGFVTGFLSCEPVLCLVTDRRRLAAAIGISASDALSALVAQVEGAMHGGINLVQVREPDLDARTLLALTRRLVSLPRLETVRILVNDRLDVALAAGADGVHLKESGCRPTRARALAPGALIGRSIHDVGGPRDSEGADYVTAGPVFETVSKPGHPAPLGLEGLRTIVESAGSLPVIAIGGITASSTGRVRRAGAAGAAAISALIPAGPVADLAGAVQELAQALRIGFDSHKDVS